MTKFRDLHKKWMEDPEYREAYEGMEAEFTHASDAMKVNMQADLTQEHLAQRQKIEREQSWWMEQPNSIRINIRDSLLPFTSTKSSIATPTELAYLPEYAFAMAKRPCL